MTDLSLERSGSFGQSCKSISISGTTLKASCGDGKGGNKSTSIDTRKSDILPMGRRIANGLQKTGLETMMAVCIASTPMSRVQRQCSRRWLESAGMSVWRYLRWQVYVEKVKTSAAERSSTSCTFYSYTAGTRDGRQDVLDVEETLAISMEIKGVERNSEPHPRSCAHYYSFSSQCIRRERVQYSINRSASSVITEFRAYRHLSTALHKRLLDAPLMAKRSYAECSRSRS